VNAWQTIPAGGDIYIQTKNELQDENVAGTYGVRPGKYVVISITDTGIGMDGGETYDRLKEMDPNVKVLLSSGYSLDGKTTEILKRGCDSFIQKPFNLKKLSEKLRQVITK